MGRRALGVVVLLAALAVGAVAEEEAVWTRHTLGEGLASIALPPTWRTHADPDGFWMYAEDPKDPASLFAWSRTPLGEDATLGRFYERQLDAERGATIDDVGFRVDDVAFRPLAGKDAIWTLVRRPGATPPTRSLYLHLRDGNVGHALRVDVALGTFDAKRAFVQRLLTSFALRGRGGTGEALRRIRARMEEHPPRTREEFGRWMEELRLIGEEAGPALRALVEKYVAGPGADDDVARAFLGHRKFEHEIPEEIAFRGHPFLETVADANEKRWFSTEERPAYEAAEKAWLETVRHALRLDRDPRYRAADQAFANLAHDPTLSELHLTFHWVDPYVLCGVSREGREKGAVRAELERRGRALAERYRKILETYGDTLGVKDLMAPWGGRPDYGSYRSFEDGVPLVVLVFEGPETWKHAQALARYLPPLVVPSSKLDPRTGRLELIGDGGPVEDGMGAARQLLYWFSKQKSRWRTPRLDAPFLVDGASAWLGSGGGRKTPLLDEMRAAAGKYEERELAYPVLDVRRMLASTSLDEAVRWIGEEHGLAGRPATALFRQQAWALFDFLHEAQGGKLRPALLDLLEAWLDREVAHGTAADRLARLLDLSDDGGWEALQTRFDAHVRVHLLASALAVRRPVPVRRHPAPPVRQSIVLKPVLDVVLRSVPTEKGAEGPYETHVEFRDVAKGSSIGTVVVPPGELTEEAQRTVRAKLSGLVEEAKETVGLGLVKIQSSNARTSTPLDRLGRLLREVLRAGGYTPILQMGPWAVVRRFPDPPTLPHPPILMHRLLVVASSVATGEGARGPYETRVTFRDVGRGRTIGTVVLPPGELEGSALQTAREALEDLVAKAKEAVGLCVVTLQLGTGNPPPPANSHVALVREALRADGYRQIRVIGPVVVPRRVVPPIAPR